MKRAWRLKDESDVQRVWQEGRAFAHPLVILRLRRNGLERTRAAVVAGKKLGNAVRRNHAKRRLRQSLQPYLPQLEPGYDLVLIAREGISEAPFTQLVQAIAQLLKRGQVLK